MAMLGPRLSREDAVAVASGLCLGARAAPPYGPGRRCAEKTCGKPLSRYNREARCFACQQRETRAAQARLARRAWQEEERDREYDRQRQQRRKTFPGVCWMGCGQPRHHGRCWVPAAALRRWEELKALPKGRALRIAVDCSIKSREVALRQLRRIAEREGLGRRAVRSRAEGPAWFVWLDVERLGTR